MPMQSFNGRYALLKPRLMVITRRLTTSQEPFGLYC